MKKKTAQALKNKSSEGTKQMNKTVCVWLLMSRCHVMMPQGPWRYQFAYIMMPTGTQGLTLTHSTLWVVIARYSLMLHNFMYFHF